MVYTGTWDSQPVTVSLRADCLIVSVGPPDRAQVVSTDRAGRLWTAFLDGISYRRGLNGRVIARQRAEGGPRRRDWLTPDEARQVEVRATQILAGLRHTIDGGQAQFRVPLPSAVHDAITRAAGFTPIESARDARRYAEVYRPVGILPPDQYMALVLQMTEGCSFNTCTFCSFYKDRVFHIKTPDELRAHAVAVHDFLGAGISLRRSIFLADANALVVPMGRLLPLLDVIHDVFDVERMGGMYAFLDGFSGEKKSAVDYATLRALGLRRIYVGLESGSADVLRFLKKPGDPNDAVHAVQTMKEAGLSVGVIVLLGAGGQQFAAGHVAGTVDALNAMRLDADDILYFSDLVISPDLPYALDARQARLATLDETALAGQGEAIRRGLTRIHPRISRYDIREFVY